MKKTELPISASRKRKNTCKADALTYRRKNDVGFARHRGIRKHALFAQNERFQQTFDRYLLQK